MRRICVLAATALVVFAGCGGDDDSSGKEPNPLAKQVESWRFAAVSYNALLQTCQVVPKQGAVIPTCTRKWRVPYGRETERLRRTLQSQQPSSSECEQAVARTRSIVDETTQVYTRTYANYTAAERARLADREYSGPPVFDLVAEAKKTTDRNARTAQQLADEIRDSCDA